MGYRTCPYCGANLDPDEKCDCQKDGEGEKTEMRMTRIRIRNLFGIKEYETAVRRNTGAL